MNGDKVWVFLPETQKIERATIIGELRGFDCVVTRLGNGNEMIFHKNWSCFKTRKALCEHYKEIFQEDGK